MSSVRDVELEIELVKAKTALALAERDRMVAESALIVQKMAADPLVKQPKTKTFKSVSAVNVALAHISSSPEPLHVVVPRPNNPTAQHKIVKPAAPRKIVAVKPVAAKPAPALFQTGHLTTTTTTRSKPLPAEMPIVSREQRDLLLQNNPSTYIKAVTDAQREQLVKIAIHAVMFRLHPTGFLTRIPPYITNVYAFRHSYYDNWAQVGVVFAFFASDLEAAKNRKQDDTRPLDVIARFTVTPELDATIGELLAFYQQIPAFQKAVERARASCSIASV